MAVLIPQKIIYLQSEIDAGAGQKCRKPATYKKAGSF